MKIRTHFVSNSSSTSFTICGVHMSQDEVLEVFHTESPYDLETLGLDIIHNFEWNNHYFIGLILSGNQEHCEMTSKMRDDETRQQFQQRVKDILDKQSGKDLEVTMHSAGWYNG